MLLLALSGCETVGSVAGAGANTAGAAAGTAYDKTTGFIETSSGKIVKTVVDGAGKVAGYVVFDAVLRTPLYFVGVSSGPFANRSAPTGFDKYVLNPVEDGYQWLVDQLGDGGAWTTETTVRVVSRGGEMIVTKGGEVIGNAGSDVAKLGESLYRDIPSFDISSGTASSAPARPAAPAPSRTVTSVPADIPPLAPDAPRRPVPAPAAPRSRPAADNFDYNHPGLYTPAR